MGLFDFFLGRATRSNRGGMPAEYREALREMRKQKSKLYRTMRMAVIFAAVMSGTLFALAIMVSDLRKEGVFKFVFIIFALCAGGGMTLPWITQFERDRRKAANGEKVAAWRKYVVFGFWGLIGVCTLLWIISVFVLGDGIKLVIEYAKLNSDEIPNFDKPFKMLRTSIIVTMQVAIGSVIATSTMRYGKKYMMLRVIIYVALLYLDFWFTWFVGGVTIYRLTHTFTPISNTLLWVLAVMATVALATAGGIFGAQARRKEIELFMKGDMKALTEGDVDLIDTEAHSDVGKAEPFAPAPAPKPETKDPEQQLTKIKELFDKGIITEEEYQAKRKDIIDKM
ncbi:MAG: SHOCT domain-containing protein [Clostridiales bacterium]|nr:SHOCT domain-containing protein [Clostridiales bacterium]